jgi:4-aminobutyrate aminotransferase
MTFAKGLGNGLAIGGVVGRPELIDSVQANSISTFGGNPLAAAGALANLEYILSHDLQANALNVGTHLQFKLGKFAKNLSTVAEVRGKGLMIAIELVKPDTLDPDPAAATAVMQITRQAGLLIGKGGLYGNVLRIAPPMTVTLEEADEAITILQQALSQIDSASRLS